MDSFRTRAFLTLTALIVMGGGQPTLAAEVSRHPDACEVLATTGRSEAGRARESGETCARVDHRLSPRVLRPPARTRERPIDRLRSRGEGAPKATGDKGARRQFNAEQRNGR